MNRGFLALTLALCSVGGLAATIAWGNEHPNSDGWFYSVTIGFVCLGAAAGVLGSMATTGDRSGDRANLVCSYAAVLIGGAICALALVVLYAILFVDLTPAD
jgi:hypothetical protein